jgi:tetratricopeptide (TPR) repeat protein
VLLLGVIGLAVLLGLAWRFGTRFRAAAPPEVEVEDDPVLAEAIEAARRKVTAAPSSADAWGGLGKLLRGSGYHPEAVACFAQAERLAPADPRWPYLRGEGLLPGDPEAALPHLRRAVERADRSDPDNVGPRLRLGEVLLRLGNYEEAEAALLRAEEIDPENPSVGLNLGLLAYARDDLEAAWRHLSRCATSPFTQQRACSCLATVSARLGRKADAAAFNQQANTLPRDTAWPDPFVLECLQLAVGKPQRFRRIEHLETQGRSKEAVELLRELVERQPDPRAWLGLGRNLAALGDGRGAEDALRTAIRLTPENAQAHYHLGKLLYARGEALARGKANPAEAARAFAEAAGEARLAGERDPLSGLAQLVLGLSLKQLGKRKEALAALRAAASRTPDLAEAHLHLGEMLAEDGRKDEARRSLERAVQVASPDDPRPREALARLNRR